MSSRIFRVSIDIVYDSKDFGHLTSEALKKRLEGAVNQALYSHKVFHLEGKCFTDVNVEISTPLKVGPVEDDEEPIDDERCYKEDYEAAGFTPPPGALSIYDPHPRRDAAKTLRELVEYADAADPQLIDALHELACLCEADAPTALIQDQLRVLASDVNAQAPMMAEDLRCLVNKLDVDE